MTTISLIAAMAKRRVMGRDGQLPWHLPADLKHFKAITLDKPIVMGRKTYESIGKPLPQRTNIILTTDPAYQAPGCYVVHHLDEAMKIAKGAEEILIIGGAQIYEAYLPLAQRMYLTLIDADIEGDTFFPDFDEAKWQVVSREDHLPDEKNSYGYRFLVLEACS